MKQRIRIVWFSMFATWLVLAVCGLSVMGRYQVTPGQSDVVNDSDWPATDKIHRDKTKFTLVLLLHPRCACSRATVEELANVMSRCEGHITGYALFLKPAEMPANWERAELWDSVSKIDGVTPMTDIDGAEAKKFGAETSGQAVLFDPAGKVVFRGGITVARGHFGDSAGQESVVSIVTGHRPIATATPVYGCPLFDPDSPANATCAVPEK